MAEYDELRSKTRSQRENQAISLKIKFKKSQTSDTSNSNNKSEMSKMSEASTYIEPTTTNTDYKIYIDNPEVLTNEETH